MTQVNAHAERIENLTLLSTQTQVRASKDRAFKRAISTLSNDVAYIAAALDDDPEIWRSHRAFHIVHVPSLIAVLTLLDDIDQMSKVSE